MLCGPDQLYIINFLLSKRKSRLQFLNLMKDNSDPHQNSLKNTQIYRVLIPQLAQHKSTGIAYSAKKYFSVNKLSRPQNIKTFLHSMKISQKIQNKLNSWFFFNISTRDLYKLLHFFKKSYYNKNFFTHKHGYLTIKKERKRNSFVNLSLSINNKNT